VSRRIAAALVVLALPATPAKATDFNGGSIAIPDSGAAAPYPSTIAVSGLTRAVGHISVRIRLTRVTAGRPAAVKIPLPAALKHQRRLTARVAVMVSDGSVHQTARKTFRIHA